MGEKEKTPLVTEADHEQGFAEIDVEFRSGRKAVWPIRALPARTARRVFIEMLDARDPDALLKAALPEGVTLADVDKLTLESLGRVEEVASVLAFGERDQKKMAAAAAALARIRFDRSSPANSGSSAPASDTPKSGAGASPSSASTSTN